MLDDDMMMEALRETNILKTIVTNEEKTDLERKGKQSTQGMLYARLMGFSNGNIQSLYDKSDGFYRRQLILTTRERPAGRVDDPMLGEKLISEVEGITLWCLEGLSRLVKNNMKFTMSEAAMNNIEEAKREDNNVIDFLESDGYLVFEADGRSTCKALYEAYIEWCKDNIKKPFIEKTFVSGLKSLSSKYGITYMEKIKINRDKYAAGFRGVYPRHI